MKFRFGLIRDSRGKGSWTHTLAIPIVVFLTIKILFVGTSIPLPWGFTIVLQQFTVAEYLTLVQYWMGFFLFRETTEKAAQYFKKKEEETNKSLLNG